MTVGSSGGVYTCTLVARNAVGKSSPSEPYIANGSPGMVTDLSDVNYENQQTTLSFMAPPDNGAAITQYEVSVNGVTQASPLASDDVVALAQNGVT